MSEGSNVLKGNKRVVYVDLEDELDEVDGEIDVDLWLPRETLGVLCRASCNVASDAACDHGVVDSALCAQRGHGGIDASLCSTDAVNHITRRWPPSEPYALADASGSDVKPIQPKRRQYQERHNYAKALLCSDRELEKLSRKIRTEIQLSEMLELAVEAECAANAGLPSFSAKSSTFGSEEFPLRYSRVNVLRSRNFSEGSIPFVAHQIPAYKELKRFELRKVSEVIPPWKELHSQMRTHLFRCHVKEVNLLFCEEEFKKSSTPVVNPLDLSARSIAQNSLLFLENIADSTISRIKKHPMMAGIPLRGTFAYHESCQDSKSSISKRTEFEPTLTQPWSATSNYRRTDIDVRPALDNAHGGESAPSSNVTESLTQGRMALLSGMCADRKEYRCCQEYNQGPGSNSIIDQSSINHHYPSIEDQVSSDHPTSYFNSCSPILEKAVEQESLRTRTPRRGYSSSQLNEDFETPVGLRDIRVRRAGVVTSDVPRERFEPSSIVDTCLLDGEYADNGRFILSTHNLESDPSLFLSIPAISGRSNTHYGCRGRSIDPVPARNILQMDLHVFPGAKSNGAVEPSPFLGSLESRERSICEEKKEPDPFCRPNERSSDGSCNDFKVKSSVENHSDDDQFETLPQNLVHPNLRDPFWCDLESCDEESSTSQALRNTRKKIPSLLSSPSPGAFGTRKLWTPRTTLSREHPLRLSKVTPKLFQNHGMCRSFSSTDENFQMAVEAMMAGLSPTSPSWSQQPFIGEDENDDFLTNYFYRTRQANDLHMKSRRIHGRTCVDPCQENGFSVDSVCSDIYQIFSHRTGGSGIENAEPRKRAVSLDVRVPTKSYHTSWLGAVQSLFSRCGSSSETALGESSSEKTQFDPPHLKKNTDCE